MYVVYIFCFLCLLSLVNARLRQQEEADQTAKDSQYFIDTRVMLEELDVSFKFIKQGCRTFGICERADALIVLNKKCQSLLQQLIEWHPVTGDCHRNIELMTAKLEMTYLLNTLYASIDDILLTADEESTDVGDDATLFMRSPEKETSLEDDMLRCCPQKKGQTW